MSRPFASIERVLIPEIQNEVAQFDAHVGVELPHEFQAPTGRNFLLPIVVLDRIAGANLDPILDRPVVDIDVYAADRRTAQDISEVIRHFLVHELPGRRIPHRGHGVVITRTRVIVGPRSLPHADSTIRRYSANYEFIAHTSP